MLTSMLFRSTALLACFVTTLAASTGCGDSSTSGGGGAGAEGSGGGQAGAGGGVVDPGNCTVITQTTDGTTYSSTGAVTFQFEPSMGEAGIPEVVSISPGNAGIVPIATTNLEGIHGLTTVFASVDAVTDLINADVTAMDARLFSATSGTITIEDAPDVGTQFKGRIKGKLRNVKFYELDDNFDIIQDGDCFFLESGTFDATGWEVDCNAPVDIASTPSGGACMADYAEIGHDCNPVNNDGCLSTQICDWGGYFRCYDVAPDDAPLCGPCDNLDGPHCQVGMTCDSDGSDGSCYRYCCTDADCGGGTCIAYSFAPIGVGVCFTK